MFIHVGKGRLKVSVGKNNTIKINGKHYDARSGAVLESAAGQAGRTIDGIIAQGQPAAAIISGPAEPSGRQAPPLYSLAAPSMQDVIRPTASVSGRRPQPSHTLMRHAVKKPGPKTHLKAQTPTHYQLSKRPAARHLIALKTAVYNLDERRLQRARRIGRSQAISRYGDSQFRPTAAAAAAAAGQLPASHNDPAFSVPAARPAARPAKPKTTADLLEHALSRATSHQQPVAKKQRRVHHRRLVAVGIGFVSLALIAFVAFQNVTDIKLQLASAKAGFSAGMPAYRPSGFHVAGVQYSPGVVAIKFQSNSDARTYSLTEKSSDWDSATLREMFVVNTTSSYQTISAGGRTVYLYGNGQATWVNGGIWYQVQSNGALSNRQLIELATSF